MTPIKLVRKALLSSQRLKSTIVKGQKPTRRQLLAVESDNWKALMALIDINLQLQKHKGLYAEVEELVNCDILTDECDLAKKLKSFKP